MPTLNDFLQEIDAYKKSIRHAHDLIAIHKSLNQGQGRRHREMALNRSVVVMTVASWQAFNQDVARMVVAGMKPKSDEYEKAEYYRGALSDWTRRKASVTESIGRYSTPNSENTQKLLSSVGYDARENWHWEGNSFESVIVHLDEWLKVRHAIAHGGRLPPVSVLGRKRTSGDPTLRRADAEDCIEFFRRLFLATITTIGR